MIPFGYSMKLQDTNTQYLNIHLNDLNSVAKDLIKRFEDTKIWLFEGEMGAGKTTLIRYLCDSIGIEDFVNSPTYNIINEYKILKKRHIPSINEAITDGFVVQTTSIKKNEKGDVRAPAFLEEIDKKNVIYDTIFTDFENDFKDDEYIYHFDLYRLDKAADLVDLDIFSYINSNNYCFFEWPSKLKLLNKEETSYTKILDNPTLLLDIDATSTDTRNISLIKQDMGK